MELSDKSILLTGASRGIGRETALAFARHGGKLVLAGRNQDSLEETRAGVEQAGGEAIVVAGDVNDAGWRKTVVEKTIQTYGGLDILVNNAGVVSAGWLENLSEDDVNTQLQSNLVAPILLTRAALPALRQSPKAAIVNISSIFGLVGMPFYATYGATKAGIAHFGEAMRRELADQGIHVMTVYPGATDTPMMETAGLGDKAGFAYDTPEGVAEALVEGLKADQLSLKKPLPNTAACEDEPLERKVMIHGKRD
ncbi:SDR family NAD(P)-dependent oxidoreductase [Marinobacter sp. ELB17]|uniref:SDR family NAD(P)-dependent oxidoreductase n=1 Tax=Marinobacter sp. ELB17 TaxID=270374 RepID=UPI0000F3B579|nr:SDR family oxidoreductase [Marinobacter sp. ELB17]EAZ97519.1 oxidoreductase [Marinobacter sp. ELB17]